MVINFVLVVSTVLWSVTAPRSLPPGSLSSLTAAADARAVVVNPELRLAATADSFSPAPPKVPKRRAPARRRSPAIAPVGGPPRAEPADEAPTPRPALRRRPATLEESEQEPSTGEEDDADEKPRASTKPRPARRHDAEDDGDRDGDDEEEEDGDAPVVSLPVILPRLIAFGVGGSLLGRSFAFDGPLQKENAFPRLGVMASLEAYPLIRMGRGWYRTLGIGANLGIEFGNAALRDPPTGLTASYPVSQRRISFDVRYAIPLGERVVIVPALGLGNNTFDLKNNMPVAPSQCSGTPPTVGGIVAPCLADVQVTYLIADLNLRVAATEHFALSLAGGYFLGLAVGQGQGQIGQERTPKMTGFHGSLGGTLMLSDWFAVRAEIPIMRYGYTFSGGTVTTYSAATETYYGAALSAVIFN